jgi:hypothetical protein
LFVRIADDVASFPENFDLLAAGEEQIRQMSKDAIGRYGAFNCPIVARPCFGSF